MDYLASLADRDIATKSDLDVLESKLTAGTDALKADINSLTARIDALGARLDRIVLAIIAALVVLVARSFF